MSREKASDLLDKNGEAPVATSTQQKITAAIELAAVDST
jgi:hypothetical protein